MQDGITGDLDVEAMLADYHAEPCDPASYPAVVYGLDHPDAHT